jgi:hypothetical protein
LLAGFVAIFELTGAASSVDFRRLADVAGGFPPIPEIRPCGRPAKLCRGRFGPCWPAFDTPKLCREMLCWPILCLGPRIISLSV